MVGENRRVLKGEEEERSCGRKRTEVENEEQNHQNEHYRWPQWEWCEPGELPGEALTATAVTLLPGGAFPVPSIPTPIY